MLTAGALGFAKVLAYAAILDSQSLGYYGLGILLSGLGTYVCHLGVYHGLDCLLPPLYGSGKAQKATRLRNTAAGLILAGSVAVIAATWIACWLTPALTVMTRLVICTAAFLAGANALLGVGLQDLRSRGNTLTFGGTFLAKSALCLVSGMLVGRWLGSVGILAAEAGVAVGLLFLVVRRACPEFGFAVPRWRILKGAVRCGLPLLAKNVLNDLALSLERWCIPAAFGIAALGQYSFGFIAVSAAMLVHNAVWSAVGPEAAYAYGRHGDARRMLGKLHRWTLALGAAALFGWWPTQWLVRHLGSHWFPEYRTGTELLAILYCGAAFQLVSLYDWVPMVLQRTAGLVWVTIASLTTTGVLLVAAASFQWPLAAYAWIFVAGRAVAAAGQFLLACGLARAYRRPNHPARHPQDNQSPQPKPYLPAKPFHATLS